MVMPTKEQVFDAMRPVIDPELNLPVVDLGLIYEVECEEETATVHVHMTLTSPACPVGPQLMGAIHSQVIDMEGVENVDIQLVWTPPWDPRTMASEDVLMMLGIWEM